MRILLKRGWERSWEIEYTWKTTYKVANKLSIQVKMQISFYAICYYGFLFAICCCCIFVKEFCRSNILHPGVDYNLRVQRRNVFANFPYEAYFITKYHTNSYFFGPTFKHTRCSVYQSIAPLFFLYLYKSIAPTTHLLAPSLISSWLNFCYSIRFDSIQCDSIRFDVNRSDLVVYLANTASILPSHRENTCWSWLLSTIVVAALWYLINFHPLTRTIRIEFALYNDAICNIFNGEFVQQMLHLLSKLDRIISNNCELEQFLCEEKKFWLKKSIWKRWNLSQ